MTRHLNKLLAACWGFFFSIEKNIATQQIYKSMVGL